jgi:REP element-mobilizing transposase RayT
MAHSYSQILLHIVFATKYRQPFIDDTFRDELHAVIGGVIRKVGGVLLAAGSIEDHIHLLVSLPRNLSAADLVQRVKAISSNWIRSSQAHRSGFAWQTGYGVFSVSTSQSRKVKAYILNQREHHRRQTSKSEIIQLLMAHKLLANNATFSDE